jgi:uncharacterized membrane protein (UPF0127 family)
MLQISLIVAAIIVVAAVAWPGRSPKTTPVKLGSHTYQLETASTAAAKEQGLSGRAGMPVNHGMVFTYAVSGQQCFWMKDMRFSLDMIWLDSAHKIVKITPDLAPKTYPANYCALAQYVVELNAGQAAQAGLQLGQTAYGL